MLDRTSRQRVEPRHPSGRAGSDPGPAARHLPSRRKLALELSAAVPVRAATMSGPTARTDRPHQDFRIGRLIDPQTGHVPWPAQTNKIDYIVGLTGSSGRSGHSYASDLAGDRFVHVLSPAPAVGGVTGGVGLVPVTRGMVLVVGFRVRPARSRPGVQKHALCGQE